MNAKLISKPQGRNEVDGREFCCYDSEFNYKDVEGYNEGDKMRVVNKDTHKMVKVCFVFDGQWIDV